MKWIFALVLVLIMAGSAGAMAQHQDMTQQRMDEEGKVVDVDTETKASPENPAGEIEVESEVDVGVNGDSSKPGEVEVDVDVSTETPAGETQTEVSIEKKGMERPVVSHRERISERLKERIQKYIEVKNVTPTEKHRLIKVKEQLKIKIQNTRQECIDAANKYIEAKQKYLELRKKPNAPVQARIMLNAGSEYIERWFDRIELAVINADNMDEDTKIAILDRIDEYRTEIEGKKEELNETSDIAKMRGVAKELNDYWGEVRVFIKSVVYQLAAAKLELLIDKAEDVEVRLQLKIEEMKASALDTAKLEELLSEYKNNVDLAKENVEKAEELLLNATTIDQVREGHKLIVDASHYLKEAFKDVRLMVKEYRKGTFFVRCLQNHHQNLYSNILILQITNPYNSPKR
ncbi:MAG TPA: hypothetical protein EYP30_00660 [Archaeoglobaceae archaeon]|nr:hypothetical protein [Archaeoglobaceae archaeon]